MKNIFKRWSRYTFLLFALVACWCAIPVEICQYTFPEWRLLADILFIPVSLLVTLALRYFLEKLCGGEKNDKG